MIRRLALLAMLTLLAGPLVTLAVSRPAMAEEAEKQGDDATKEGDETKKDDENKKVDKYLGIDWGDSKDKKTDDTAKDDPDAKQPGQEVDLKEKLEKGQLTRLEKIERDIERAVKLKEEGEQAASGEHKKLKKADAVTRFESAAKIYHKAVRDVETLAKGIKDEDTKLTLLRKHKDPYSDQACELFCRAGNVVIELAKNLGQLKRVATELNSARQVDENHPAIEETRNAAREAAKAMMTKLAEAQEKRSSEGGDPDKDNQYDDGRDDRDYKETGREDYKRIGR